MEDPFSTVILCSLVILSGFFSFAAAVLGLARKPRLHFRAPGKKRTPALLGALEKPEFFVLSLRLWNMLFIFAAGVFTVLFCPFRPVLLSAGVLVLALGVFSELLPRLLAARDPERFLPGLFPLIEFLSLPWKPLYILASRIPLLKNRPAPAPGEEYLRLALEEGEKTGAVESSERSMVEGVLYLGDKPVSAFMIHRSEIEWLDIDAPREEVREKALAHKAQGFFPVVRGTQDDIAGVVSVQDIFIALSGEWGGLQKIMRKPLFIPETLGALKALETFKREDEYYLCVMDEYGGFAGSLRFRDLVIGTLTRTEKEAVLQEDGAWLAEGSISMDELAETLGLEELEEENTRDYHTLAGFILKLAGEIPRTGESFSWKNLHFKVLDLDGNRIHRVRISKIE
ncbi:MAG: hemolysin family protein [Spirochaetaceae bacterium]|jgi:putative hemolysin|nr:hemolysin family protein [Spirochaetaceae bacterium]